MTYLRSRNFLLDVSMGLVPGHSIVNKFGANATADTGHDLWTGGGVYGFYPTTAQSMELVSDDPDDDDGDTGARTVLVYGLDGSWDVVSETVTLNGVGAVNLTEHTYLRVFRMIVMSAGSSKTNEGTISCQIQTGGTVAAEIAAGAGQTQMAIYTTPNGKTGYFLKGYVGVADDDKAGESALFQWKMRLNDTADGAWAIKGEMGLNTLASSWWQYEYGAAVGPIPEKTDIRIMTKTMTAVMGVVGGFDLLLVDD